jgi:hypothetical protein
MGVECDILGARRLQQLQKLGALDQNLALAGDSKRIQLALANVGPNTGLTQLQVSSGLFHGQQISGFGLHSCLVLSLVAAEYFFGVIFFGVMLFRRRGVKRIQYILIASRCQQTLKILAKENSPA